MKYTTLLATVTLGFSAFFPVTSKAASAAEIDREVNEAARSLYASNPAAKALTKQAKAVLIFPSIVKAGFLVGGQFGEGALIENGYIVGYYSSAAASYGLQAGVQKFGYALFFMNHEDLSYLKRSKGWEVGVGPSVVIVDKGLAKNLSSTTLQKGVYAYFFNQQGLMAGLGVQGSKITRIFP